MTAIQRDLMTGHDADAEALHEAIRVAADDVGHKEFLWLLGNCDRTTLANRLACRDGRTPSAQMVLVLARADEHFMATLCRLAGYAPPKRLVDETPAEKLERLVDAVRREHGAAGAATIAAVFGPVSP